MKALSLVLVLAGGLAHAQPWTELGPKPISNGFVGRVSAVACSRSNANLTYIGAADGGVWKTLDGGTTWVPLTDAWNTSAVGAVAVDPTNDQVVYVGTGEANYANHSRYGLGLLKSTDGGATWQRFGEGTFAGRTFSKIVIDPASPSTLYAAVAAAGGFPEKVAAKGHPLRNGPMGVFKSTDGGQTWVQLGGGLPNQAATDVALVESTPNVLFAAIGRPFGAAENGVYKSVDSGATWSKITTGGLPGTGNGRISVASSRTNPNRVYALIVNPADASGGGASTRGTYRSDDGGATWATLGAGSFQSSYGWFLCAIGVHPTNADIALFAGLDMVRTTNAGTGFSTVTPPHVDNHAIDWDASGRLVVGCDGGVFQSSNDGTSWAYRNVGLSVCQFYPGVSTSSANANVLLGGLQDNGSVLRNAAGTSWGYMLGGDGGYTAIAPTNPNLMFIQFQGTGNLYRSTNGGGSFGLSRTGINTADRSAFYTPLQVDPANANRVLLGTHRLYQSTNAGANWAAISPDVTLGTGAIRSIAISAANTQVVWVGTNEGRLLVSTNGGVSFSAKFTGLTLYPRVTREITAHPSQAGTAYLAVGAFGVDQVLRTTDFGATWTSLDGNLPDLPVNVVEVSASGSREVLLAGTDDGVYASLLGSGKWTRLGVGMPRTSISDIRVDEARGRVIAATMGRGLWEIAMPWKRSGTR